MQWKFRYLGPSQATSKMFCNAANEADESIEKEEEKRKKRKENSEEEVREKKVRTGTKKTRRGHG